MPAVLSNSGRDGVDGWIGGVEEAGLVTLNNGKTAWRQRHDKGYIAKMDSWNEGMLPNTEECMRALVWLPEVAQERDMDVQLPWCLSDELRAPPASSMHDRSSPSPAHACRQRTALHCAALTCVSTCNRRLSPLYMHVQLCVVVHLSVSVYRP
jgi:hypothetical protein